MTFWSAANDCSVTCRQRHQPHGPQAGPVLVETRHLAERPAVQRDRLRLLWHAVLPRPPHLQPREPEQRDVLGCAAADTAQPGALGSAEPAVCPASVVWLSAATSTTRTAAAPAGAQRPWLSPLPRLQLRSPGRSSTPRHAKSVF